MQVVYDTNSLNWFPQMEVRETLAIEIQGGNSTLSKFEILQCVFLFLLNEGCVVCCIKQELHGNLKVEDECSVGIAD